MRNVEWVPAGEAAMYRLAFRRKPALAAPVPRWRAGRPETR